MPLNQAATLQASFSYDRPKGRVVLPMAHAETPPRAEPQRHRGTEVSTVELLALLDGLMADEKGQLTSAIIGAAIEVHRVLGQGLLESAYEQALREELRMRGSWLAQFLQRPRMIRVQSQRASTLTA